MFRRSVFSFPAAIIIGLSGLDPAAASSPLDYLSAVDSDAPGYSVFFDLIQRLEDDNSEILLLERTFLGRLRIVYVDNGNLREIVMSPNTADIRRDITIGAYDAASFPGQGQGQGIGSGQGLGNGNSGSGSKGKKK